MAHCLSSAFPSQSPLERLVSIGIDPMIFHLFQGGSGFDLFFLRSGTHNLPVPVLILLDGIQRTGFIAKMRPQLAQTGARIQGSSGSSRAAPRSAYSQCFFQPAAIHQRHRIPVVPGSAARGVFLRILHPFRSAVVVDVIVQIKAGKGIPEGNLQILVSLFFAESSFFYATFDKSSSQPSIFSK